MTISIHTNTLFPNGAPKAPDGPSRKQLAGLNQIAHDSLIRALAESHLHEMISKEVGRQLHGEVARLWADYKDAMSHLLAGMIDEQLGEMFKDKDMYAALQVVVMRLIQEDRDSHAWLPGPTENAINSLDDRLKGVIADNADLQEQIRNLEQRVERRKKGR